MLAIAARNILIAHAQLSAPTGRMAVVAFTIKSDAGPICAPAAPRLPAPGGPKVFGVVFWAEGIAW
jgi:hypothetical protein